MQIVWKVASIGFHCACAALESDMTHISGFERSQLLLLPEAVDDYVGPDNPVRFIDAFVDGLDLAGAGFRRVEPKATGRPGYAPGDLLKLYIYGYLNRVRSRRRLEMECHRDIEVNWLLRSLKPGLQDHRRFQERQSRRVQMMRVPSIASNSRKAFGGRRQEAGGLSETARRGRC
jgi:transposase